MASASDTVPTQTVALNRRRNAMHCRRSADADRRCEPPTRSDVLATQCQRRPSIRTADATRRTAADAAPTQTVDTNRRHATRRTADAVPTQTVDTNRRHATRRTADAEVDQCRLVEMPTKSHDHHSCRTVDE